MPPLGDKQLASGVRNALKYALIFHLAVAFVMLSNIDMFDVKDSYACVEEDNLIMKIPFIDIIFDKRRF